MNTELLLDAPSPIELPTPNQIGAGWILVSGVFLLLLLF